MESIDLKRLNLTIEESRDIINFIRQKRGISTKKLLSTIKPNLKHTSNEILTAKTHQEATKTQQVAKTQQKSLKLQNLTSEKPPKLVKRENLTSQKQQIVSKNKKRIEIAREKLKELHHKFPKSDLKTIKRHLYNIENKKRLLESETTKEYFDELDKKFLEFDEYYNDNDNDDYFIGIENVQDLFKISIYKPTIVKSGYNNNYYIEYKSEIDKLLTIEEYLNLIEPYLRKLINDHKNKGEWKIQLTAQINFISVRPGSDETRVMHTKSINEEFMNGSDGVNYLYYDLNKISISKGGLYIDSPKWLKDKK